MIKERKHILSYQVVNLSEPSMAPIPYRNKEYDITDYIPFGSDNLFPQALAYFARSSANHRGVINSKVTYLLGDGIIPVDEKDKETALWLDNINFEQQNISFIQSKEFLDECIFGNGYVEIITDRKKSFVFLNHIDASKCRKSSDSKSIIMNPDWNKDTGKGDKARTVLPLYPEFAVVDGVYRSVYHKYSYEPEFTYYGIPRYIAGRDSAQIDMKTNRWNLSRLKNSFRLSGILLIPVKDEVESKDVIQYIEKNHIGDDNNAKLLTITKSRALDNEKADQAQLIETKQDDEGSWIDLHKQSLSDIIISHSWFRSLMGVPDTTGFDTRRILNEYEIALKTVISESQKSWIDLYRRIVFDLQGRDLKIKFQNSPPLSDYRFYKIWEARKAKGLDYDENDQAQQQIIMV